MVWCLRTQQHEGSPLCSSMAADPSLLACVQVGGQGANGAWVGAGERGGGVSRPFTAGLGRGGGAGGKWGPGGEGGGGKWGGAGGGRNGGRADGRVKGWG